MEASGRQPGSPEWQTFDQELRALLGDQTPALPEHESELVHAIASEFAKGFNALAAIRPAVTIFGSARTPETHPDYALTRSVARAMGEAGYSIITGGGGGLMEAANRGARDAGALSVGCIHRAAARTEAQPLRRRRPPVPSSLRS